MCVQYVGSVMLNVVIFSKKSLLYENNIKHVYQCHMSVYLMYHAVRYMYIIFGD